MTRIGLALGGGGARGLCHIAFLKVLDEVELRPAAIAGTSIGAVIGACYAAGMSGLQMEYELANIGLRDLYKMAMDFSLFSQSAFLKGKGIEEYLLERIACRTFEELMIPLKVVATDFWNRREVVFESGDLISAVRASMAMPAVFEPVIRDNMVLIDGSAANPLPYDLVQADCDFTIAIDVSGEKSYSADDPVPNMVESILGAFQIMQASIVETKMRVSPPDLYVKPDLTDIRVLDFFRYREVLAGVDTEVASFRKSLAQPLGRR